jgi:predicted DsbA family dithiol-disulfide isomerase
MSQHKTGLSIDVYSDVVCPWCYIGKRRLEQALDATRGRGEALVAWCPFQLNPTMPKAGMDRRVYLEAKFGGPGEMKAIQERVAAVGAGVGIDFMFDRIERTPNTFDAHRLIWFAGQHHRQDEMVDALFQAYFAEGLNIGQAETLVALADRAGLDADNVGRLLRTDEGVEAVRQEESRGHRLGIRGVPYFVLNGGTALSGAQPVETFVSVIEAAVR